MDIGLGSIVGAVLGGPLGFLGGSLLVDQPNAQQERADQLQWQEGEERKGLKKKEYDLLDKLQSPQLSPQMEARIKALEDDSRPGPLSQDKYFQGARANLVQGGQQALSSVENNHAAYNTSGGFRNQGSISDVYDRLGAQMAQLGQQSEMHKAASRDAAAQARQNLLDSQIAFENARTQAKISIEQGDTQAALVALQQAYAAKQQIDAAQRAMFGQLLSIGGTVGGAVLGGPAGAIAGSQLGKIADMGSIQNQVNSMPSADSLSNYPARYSLLGR